jgi:hypothetical protein
MKDNKYITTSYQKLGLIVFQITFVCIIITYIDFLTMFSDGSYIYKGLKYQDYCIFIVNLLTSKFYFGIPNKIQTFFLKKRWSVLFNFILYPVVFILIIVFYVLIFGLFFKVDTISYLMVFDIGFIFFYPSVLWSIKVNTINE